MYNLTISNYDPVLDSFTKNMTLENYFPVYLYRSQYFLIPDFGPSHSTILAKPQYWRSDSNSLKYGVPSSHLLNDSVEGWVFKVDFFDDFPVIYKNFLVSFEIMCVEFSNFLTYDFRFDLSALILYDRGGKEIFKAKTRVTLSIDQAVPSLPISGTISFEISIFIKEVLQQTEVKVYDIVLNNVSNPEQILNSDDFDFNDFERSIKLVGLLKKTSFLQSVRLLIPLYIKI